MQDMKNYLDYDAVGLAQLVKTGEATPLELVEAAIARIEKVNERVNAVIHPMFESARAAAQGPLPEGPFTGVPFLVKDLLASVKGEPLAMGSKLMKEFVPTYDSEMVRRIRQAGFILIGKTNTPEFGLPPTTEPLAFGPTRNPWDLGCTSGGSSGGSAAAVAAGMVPAAHGNDGGGSIRIPAACCGVFGMKPTRGRFTLAPELGDYLSGFVVQGVLTRSVRDSAYWYDAIGGPALGDPYFPPTPKEPYAQSSTQDPGPLRIGFTSTPPLGGDASADSQAGVAATVKMLQGLGHHVEEKDISIDPGFFMENFVPIWTSGVAQSFDMIAQVRGTPVTANEVEPFTWALYEVGRSQSAANYLRAVQQCQLLSRTIAELFSSMDVWLTPTLGQPPLALGALDYVPEDPMRAFVRGKDFVPFTALCNVTGQPAMSVPLYWNGDGLPMGSHFVGRYGDEKTLFQLAAQLEKAHSWHQRRPPLDR